MRLFKAKDITLTLDRTYIMGILNLTPDSFSDGGRFIQKKHAIQHAINMKNDGADIIDIGAQSTRPGSETVTDSTELERLLPVLSELLNEIDIPISIDTFYPKVADECLKLGAHIINDVSGVINPEMLEVVKKHNAGYIVMHNDTMETDVKSKLTELAKAAKDNGIPHENICVDPGLGFNKITDDNTHIINDIKAIKALGYPLLIAASRKRFIGDICKIEKSDERDIATAAVSAISAFLGADIVRVHEIKGNLQAVMMADRLSGKRGGK